MKPEFYLKTDLELTVILFFLLTLFSSHVCCIPKYDLCCYDHNEGK